MKSTITAATIAGFVAATLSGCFWVTTKSEGKKLKTEVADLDTRLKTKEENIDDKVKKLQSVLDEATKLLTRNSADLGAEMETLRSDYRNMAGLVNEANRYAEEVRKEVAALEAANAKEKEALEDRLLELEKRLVALEKAASDPTPKTASDLYAVGKAAFDDGQYPKAREMFKTLVSNFPGHDKAPYAQYYWGESYYLEKDYDRAIREFQKVFDKYDDSKLADDSLYRAGEAAHAIQRCSEARAYFGLLRQKYPKSSLYKKAKSKDAQLKKDMKNKKKCVS